MTTNQIVHELKPLSARQLAALTADLNPGRISNRKGNGGAGQLSYLEAWDVKATLTKVFGFGGWSSRLIEGKIERVFTKAEIGGNAMWTVMASATIELYIHQLGAVYSEMAVSSQGNAQVGEAADFAIKTAESDALKRCAINLGTQFGLSLYNSGSTQDVVRVVLADGQEWPALNPDQKAAKELAARRELEYIEAIIDGIDPAKAREEIWGAPVESPNAQRRPVTVPEGSAQTPEQYAESQELVQRALTMKAQQAAQQEQAAGVDFAALAAQDQGQAAVLDYSAESEAYAAADGHHE
jgi:recombination DNA repair RAD52 pathway protein